MPAPSFGSLISSGLGSLFGGGGGGGSGGSSGFSSMMPYLFSSLAGNLLTPSAPSTPQLPYQGPAANNLYGDISGLTNPYSALQPYEYQQMLATMNNPNVGGYMDAARRAGGAYGAAGDQAQAGAAGLMNQASSLYNMAYDPQQALYDRLKQQTQDTSNVTNSMYGLASSPYGAGVANDAMKNFNIDWQNQQLQRAISANQPIGQDITGAQGLLTGAGQDYLTGGQLPYSTYNSILGDTTGALNQYVTQAGAGNNFTQGAIGDWLSYLGMGNNNAATNLAAYNAQQGANANTSAGLYPLFSGGGNSNPFSSGGSQPSSYWSNPNNPIYNPSYPTPGFSAPPGTFPQ